MNEIQIINKLSIDKKGKKTLYTLPTVEEYLKTNKILLSHLDWNPILNELDKRYETITDHDNDLDALREELTPEGLNYTLGLDSNNDLVYNQGKADEQTFLNKENVISLIDDAIDSIGTPPDLSIYATKSELNTLSARELSDYATLDNKFNSYALKEHNHAWTSLTGLRELTSGYLELTQTGKPTKYIELLTSTQKLTATAIPANCKAFVTEYNGKILLVAEAAAGFLFENWKADNISLSTNPIHIEEKSSTTPNNFVATFVNAQPQEVRHNINLNVLGDGRVEIKNAFDNTPITGPVVDSTLVNITAIPDEGMKFTGWINSNLPSSLLNTNPIENYAIVEDLNATARFASKTRYYYTIAINPTDSILTNLVINQVGTNQSVLEGDTFTLAVQDTDPQDYRFISWVSNNLTLTDGQRSYTCTNVGHDNILTFKDPDVTKFTAYYLKFYSVNNSVQDQFGNTLNNVNLTVEITNDGELNSNGKYSAGSVVNITAPASFVNGNDTYMFIEWNDHDTNLTRRDIAVNDNVLLVPIYGKAYNVTIEIYDHDTGEEDSTLGEVTLSDAAHSAVPNLVVSGTTLQLTPRVLNNNFLFGYWGVNIYNTQNPLEVTITEDTVIRATFRHITYDVRVIRPNSDLGTLKVNGVLTNSNIVHTDKGESLTLSIELTEELADAYTFKGWGLGEEAELIPNSNGKENGVYLYETDPITGVVTYSPVFEGSFLVQASTNPANSGLINGTGYYSSGETCTLRYESINNYVLDGWYVNNTLKSTETLYSFTVISNVTVVAKTHIPTYNVTLIVDPAGSGTITDFNGNTISSTINKGSTLKVKANPVAAYDFSHWNDDTSDTNVSKIISNVLDDVSATAHFTKKQVNVTVEASPANGGTVYVGSDSTKTSLLVDYGTSFVLHASTNHGYIFSGWKIGTGNIISGSNVAAYTVTNGVTTDTTYTAVFTKLYTINVQVPSNLSTIGSAKIVSGTTAPTTSSGSSVTITSGTKFTAKAFINSAQQAAYSFDKWTNNVDSTTNTNVQFTGTAAKDITYTAHFKINQVTITANVSPANGGTVDHDSQTVNYGGSATITASPNDGFNFIKWQKDGVDIEGGLELQLSNITSGANYTAIFEQEVTPLLLYYYYTSTTRTDINPSIANSTPLNLDQVVSVSAKRALVFLVPNSASNIQILQQILNGFEDVTDTFTSDSTSIDGYIKYYVQGTVDPLTGAGTYLNGDYKLVQGS